MITPEQEIKALRHALAEETAIVDRIWDLFGRPSYAELKGRTIYDLITEVQGHARKLETELDIEKQVSACLGRVAEDKDKDRIFFRDRLRAADALLSEIAHTLALPPPRL